MIKFLFVLLMFFNAGFSQTYLDDDNKKRSALIYSNTNVKDLIRVGYKIEHVNVSDNNVLSIITLSHKDGGFAICRLQFNALQDRNNLYKYSCYID